MFGMDIVGTIQDWLVPNRGRIDSRVPIGFTGQGCIWYTDTAPEGWLICDGSLVDKETYPALWLLLGDTWGTSTATQFYLPDLRQRVPVGKHSSGTFATLNNSGGTESHTIAKTNLPLYNSRIEIHGQGQATVIAGITANSGGFTAGTTRTSYRSGGGNISGANSIDSIQLNIGTSSPTAINHLSPYRVVNFIIKF